MKKREIKALALIPFLLVLVADLSYAQDGRSAWACCNETELTYMNGDIRLAGVLLTPVDPGEYPAAVLLQGSGTSDRSNGWARVIAETLVAKGVAILLTDKRGSGQSGGDWRTASFEDLARDGVAGISALRGLKGIRGDQLGFIGLSQGGHLSPLAASLDDVQFVIDFVGGALPMKAMLFHELEQTYKQHGIADADKTPAFVAYGELDEADNVPVKASVRRFENELDGDTLTLRVYPGTGHSLMDEDLMSQHEYQLVEPLLRDLDIWIDINIKSGVSGQSKLVMR